MHKKRGTGKVGVQANEKRPSEIEKNEWESMIDYIGDTICFFSLKWLLAFGFLGPRYLLMI